MENVCAMTLEDALVERLAKQVAVEVIEQLESRTIVPEWDGDIWLTLEDAAKITSLSERWLRDNRKDLPFLEMAKGQKTLRVSQEKLKRWMQNRP
jgi:helix-turn-helix protein